VDAVRRDPFVGEKNLCLCFLRLLLFKNSLLKALPMFRTTALHRRPIIGYRLLAIGYRLFAQRCLLLLLMPSAAMG
jgi:hypothetical protein